MKKTLSFLLALVMLVSSFAISSFNAFAATKSAAPAVKLGELFKVSIPVSDMDDEDLGKDAYLAKFIPDEKGYYEFVFDTKFVETLKPGTDMSVGVVSTMLVDSKDNPVAMGMAASAVGEGADDEDAEEVAYPSVCGELEAGKTYYLVALNMSTTDYSSNVIVNKHTHHFYNGKIESYVDDEDLSDNEDGIYYTGCDKNGCSYAKPGKTIRKVKSISLSATVLTYNGKERKPTVTIKDSKGNKIDKKNYSVKYSNNKKVGTAKVKITFKNDYEGEYTKTFKINPKGTSLKSVSAKKKGFTAKWSKQATQTTGYQIQYATNSKFTKNKKTVTVKGTKTTSKTVSKLSAKKKYYVRVRTYKTVNKKKYYSGWSKAKTVTTKR